MDLYLLTRGPFVWAAFLIFFSGCLYQIVFILAMGHQKKNLYPLDSIQGSLRSFMFGLLPFASSYMRKNPILTLVMVIFHICVFMVPLFLLAHIVLWYESWEILWWSLPESFADLMTIAVIFSCGFFLGRRFFIPEVKNATKSGDILLLILVMTPFLTGFLATHQWGPYRPILIAHILSSEILFSAIPFTRLGHMFFFWVSRAYMGAEYSKVMHTGDW